MTSNLDVDNKLSTNYCLSFIQSTRHHRSLALPVSYKNSLNESHHPQKQLSSCHIFILVLKLAEVCFTKVCFLHSKLKSECRARDVCLFTEEFIGVGKLSLFMSHYSRIYILIRPTLSSMSEQIFMQPIENNNLLNVLDIKLLTL